MPKIDKIFSLEITPERFLEACSLNELQEVSLLLDAAIRRKQVNEEPIDPKEILERIKNDGVVLATKVLMESARHQQPTCSACGSELIRAEKFGFLTCSNNKCFYTE